MKHHFSESEIAYLSRPLASIGGFWGVAIACCAFASYGYWELSPLSSADYWFPLVLFLLTAAVIGLLAVAFRRLFRPPKAQLRRACINVAPSGIWTERGNGSRKLLVSAVQLRSISFERDKFKQMRKLVLHGEGESVDVHGLADMDAFVADVLQTYERVRVRTDEAPGAGL